MDHDLLLKKVLAAKKERPLNNFYSLNVLDSFQEYWEDNDNLLFSYKDHGINRLIFFVKYWSDLDSILKKIDYGSYFLEFITKDFSEYIPDSFQLTAKMLRLANQDINTVFANDSLVLKYRDTCKVENAIIDDSNEINSILWETFHTEISHLLYDEEVKEKIMAGQFSVHRNMEGKIDALLQADVMPKKFYINQIVNRTDKNVSHAILLHRLEQYIQVGGKYVYAWVEENNIASLKFHSKYGMYHDGTLSVIYSLER